MGLRETLQKNSTVATGVAIALLVVAIGALVFELRGDQRPSAAAFKKAFYSEDGISWFLDDNNKLAPFDHNGKPAYFADVYRCRDSNKLYVRYIRKLPDSVLSEAQASVAADPNTLGHWLGGPMDRKAPGDPGWTPAAKIKQNAYYQTVNCPGGGGVAVPAAPTDPDVMNAAN